jgi:hypothetical protein
MTAVLLGVIVLLVAAIGWLLRPGPRHAGGILDLAPAAARGELKALGAREV